MLLEPLSWHSSQFINHFIPDQTPALPGSLLEAKYNSIS